MQNERKFPLGFFMKSYVKKVEEFTEYFSEISHCLKKNNFKSLSTLFSPKFSLF